MTALNKRFKKNITITRGKGSSSRTSRQQTQEKEATKEKEEEEHKQKEKEEKMKRESTDKAREEAEESFDELKGKEKEDQDMDNVEQDIAQDNPKDPTSTSGDIITRGHLPIAELGLVSFTPSKQHVVSCLDKVFFDPKWKTIVWRAEKKLKVGT